MSKSNLKLQPDINNLIIEKLSKYPIPVSELAIKAIQLAENLPEASVYESLQGIIRESIRKQGANS